MTSVFNMINETPLVEAIDTGRWPTQPKKVIAPEIVILTPEQKQDIAKLKFQKEILGRQKVFVEGALKIMTDAGISTYENNAVFLNLIDKCEIAYNDGLYPVLNAA